MTAAGTMVWTALGAVALLIESGDARILTERSQLAMSLLALVFGVWVFWRHGGRQVSAAGLYSLASAVFVGLAGLYWWRLLGNDLPHGLYVATAVGFFANLLMYSLFWRRNEMPQLAPESNRPAAQWGIAVGGMTAAAALLLYTSGIRVGQTLLTEIAFAGMALLIVSLLTHPGRRIGLGRIVTSLAVGILYFVTIFTGYGRLLLVSLGLVALIPACLRVPGRAVKILLIAALGPSVAVFSYLREQFGLATYGVSLDGTGSVTLPLAAFGRLIEAYQEGVLQLGYGSTLVVTAFFFVPRLIWAGKPDGFGAELTQILEPELVATNQSLAAHLAGEWLFNFGYLGIPAMVLVMGWTIGWVDRYAAGRMKQPLTNRRALVALTAAITLLAGIPDLQWAGTFTYWARTGSRLAVLAALLFIAGGKIGGVAGLRRTVPSRFVGSNACAASPKRT